MCCVCVRVVWTYKSKAARAETSIKPHFDTPKNAKIALAQHTPCTDHLRPQTLQITVKTTKPQQKQESNQIHTKTHPQFKFEPPNSIFRVKTFRKFEKKITTNFSAFTCTHKYNPATHSVSTSISTRLRNSKSTDDVISSFECSVVVFVAARAVHRRFRLQQLRRFSSQLAQLVHVHADATGCRGRCWTLSCDNTG